MAKSNWNKRVYTSPERPGQAMIKVNKGGKWQNYWFPTEMFDPASESYDPQTAISMVRNPKDLQQWIAKIRFPRIRVDLTQWRESLLQAEDPIFPFRWLVQQIYQDAILDAHTNACMEKCKRLTTQKKPWFFDDDGNALEEIPQELKFIYTQWWANLIGYVLDAQFFGYNLIALNDMIDGGFPKLQTVDRQNISPDRENVTPVIAMIEGIRFNDEKQKARVVDNIVRKSVKGEIDSTYFNNPEKKNKDGEPYYNWHIWVTTEKNINRSKCGIGLLYKAIPHILFIRNAYNDFADFCELFAQPLRHLTTRKTGEALKKAEDSLIAMGSNNYFVSSEDDKLELIKSQGVGESYQAYEKNIELNKKAITAIFFGHEDAMASIPGKLGAGQGGGKNAQGQENSPVQKAIREKQSEQTFWLCNVINDNVIPKLRELGFDVPAGYKYGYQNNEEESEIQSMEDLHNSEYIQNVLDLAAAGYKVPASEIQERTGYAVEQIATIPKNINIPEQAQNRLQLIYKDRHNHAE